MFRTRSRPQQARSSRWAHRSHSLLGLAGEGAPAAAPRADGLLFFTQLYDAAEDALFIDRARPARLVVFGMRVINEFISGIDARVRSGDGLAKSVLDRFSLVGFAYEGAIYTRTALMPHPLVAYVAVVPDASGVRNVAHLAITMRNEVGATPLSTVTPRLSRWTWAIRDIITIPPISLSRGTQGYTDSETMSAKAKIMRNGQNYPVTEGQYIAGAHKVPPQMIVNGPGEPGFHFVTQAGNRYVVHASGDTITPGQKVFPAFFEGNGYCCIAQNELTLRLTDLPESFLSTLQERMDLYVDMTGHDATEGPNVFRLAPTSNMTFRTVSTNSTLGGRNLGLLGKILQIDEFHGPKAVIVAANIPN